MDENDLRTALVRDLNERTRLRRITSGAVLLVTVGLSVAIATPKTFKEGEKLSANAVNANFSELDTRLAESRVVRNQKGGSYSVGATKLCGSTASLAPPFTANGKVGYQAAKVTCESTCNSPSAHMCTAAEVVRSVTLDIGPKQEGWYSSGTEGAYNATASINDCSGWQANNAGSLGMTWQVGTLEQPNRNTPYDSLCNVAHPILCCD